MKQIFCYLTVLFISLLAFNGCKKMDSKYKQFIVPGGITYTGKATSPLVYAGHNRVKISWLRGSDPNITKAMIFWNNYSDSLLVNIPAFGDSISAIINNLPENSYSFIIKTYDKKGIPSVPVEIQGSSFGDRYQSQLLDRSITGVSILDALGNVTVTWGSIDKTSGIQSTFVKYTDVNGTIIEKKSSITANNFIIANYKPGTTFQYRTSFIPNVFSVDTFYTVWNTRTVDVKITKTNWTATADCEELVGEGAINGRAKAAIDDIITTYWHTTYKPANINYPHWLVVDMKQTIIVNQVELTRRQGNNNSFNDFRIDGSMDGVNWTPYGSYTLIAGNTTQRFPLPGSHQMRYIRVYATSFTGGLNAHLAEFSVYGFYAQ